MPEATETPATAQALIKQVKAFVSSASDEEFYTWVEYIIPVAMNVVMELEQFQREHDHNHADHGAVAVDLGRMQ